MEMMTASEAREMQSRTARKANPAADHEVDDALARIMDEIRGIVSEDKDATHVSYMFEDDHVGGGKIYTMDDRRKLVVLTKLDHYDALKERLLDAGYSVRRTDGRGIGRDVSTGHIVVTWRVYDYCTRMGIPAERM